MGLLKKLRVEQKRTEEPQLEARCEPEVDPDLCPGCGGEDSWQPIGAADSRCECCQPPPAESMVRFRFFWFDGERWIVWHVNGREVWTREKFWEPNTWVNCDWGDLVPKEIDQDGI